MASALKTFPVKFNDGLTDTTLFQWEKWNETYSKVQTTNTSEAGGDLVALTRVGKLSVSCEYACTDTWLATFRTFADMPSFTLKRYDTTTGAYKSHTVRIENFAVEVERHSDYVTQSTGLYTVTFDIIEF